MKYFEDDCIKFYETLGACIAKERPTAILLSSVLQYLPAPYSFLDEVISYGFEFILVDRTPFFMKHQDRLTVQKVPASIYPASYPAWILNLGRFQSAMQKSYDLVAEFDSLDRANIPAEFRGFIYRRKKHA
jgi:putative methyltransferase (TIGR04325 family)